MKYNPSYYQALVAPLRSLAQVCSLLDDAAVRRKYGEQCDHMKERWIADNVIEPGMITGDKISAGYATKLEAGQAKGQLISAGSIQNPAILTLKGSTK